MTPEGNNPSDDDSLLALYNQELIALSSETAAPFLLEHPDAAARAVSPICGSEVEVHLRIEDNRVTAFGYEVEACALTRAVVAVMKKAIIGKNRAEVAKAGAEMEKMLAEENMFPSGDWAALKILAPVQDYKSRHNAILLPFEAVEKAFKNTL
jgi:NifU-like protein involved in Fe-S cluster formation